MGPQKLRAVGLGSLICISTMRTYCHFFIEVLFKMTFSLFKMKWFNFNNSQKLLVSLLKNKFLSMLKKYLSLLP